MPLSSHDNGHVCAGQNHSTPDSQELPAALRGKRILITGAGGFIGSAVARTLAKVSVEHLVLLDIAEAGLHALSLEMDRHVPHDLVVGDVCDAGLLEHLFERYHPQIVLHAAACKHVTLMEQNPFAAAKTNVLGSQQIAHAASVFGAEQMVLISTDKAVDPAGIMGATKRIAELIVLGNRGSTSMKAVRLGNVFASTGSVVPILREQIARGGPLTITDAACERYFVSLDDAVRCLLLASLLEARAAVLVPEAGASRCIMDVARELVAGSGQQPGALDYKFTGLRPGEKLKERMISRHETLMESSVAGLRQVLNRRLPSPKALETAIAEIAASISERGVDRLLRAIAPIVPEYQPSESLLRRADHVRSARA